jgi:hypothetical protein
MMIRVDKMGGVSLLLGEDAAHEITRQEAVQCLQHSQKLDCPSIPASAVLEAPPSRQDIRGVYLP